MTGRLDEQVTEPGGSTADELTEWWAWNRKDNPVKLWPFRSPRPARTDLPDDDHDVDCAWGGTLHLGRCDGLPAGDGADATAWRRTRTPEPHELADTEPRLPAPLRKDTVMTDNAGPGPDPYRLPASDPADPGPIEVPPHPLTDSGSHRFPAVDPGHTSKPLTPPAYAGEGRSDCSHCYGTGKVLTTHDLLRKSLDLLGTDPVELDMFVAEFYARLLDLAPELTPLFPADLRDAGGESGSAGKAQRDRLLNAMVSLASAYNPDNATAMQTLDTHLAAFGRAHAAFARPDGTVQGATLDEYAAVKLVLIGLLRDAGGGQWRPEMTAAWSEAYDYAAATMMVVAHRHAAGRELFPRGARQ